MLYVGIPFIIQLLRKIVSMIGKYDNHKLQTNPWHRKEEPHIDHKTLRRQSNQLSFSLFAIKIIASSKYPAHLFDW